MLVTCHKLPRAYTFEHIPHTHGELNLISAVELSIIEPIPGHDLAPIIVDAGCGRSFELAEPSWRWDVNTEIRDDGREWVTERHLAPRCPFCGKTADHLTETADPYPLLAADLSKRERVFFSDPELNNLLADVADDERREQLRQRLLRGIRGGSGGSQSHVTEGAIALVAATAKTIIGAKGGSAVGMTWRGYEIAFDGVTASAVPCLVEMGYCTWATNSPGTNSTGTTERQEYGRVITADWTGGRNWTAEPTTITVLREKLLSPNGGVIVYDFPLGTEPDSAVSEGFVIRVTAPAIVNVRGTQLLGHT